MSFLQSLKAMFSPSPRLDLASIAPRVQAGEILLVDVREPDEWAGGVGEHAHLLPMSDLRGPRAQWRSFLQQAKGREVFVYCASGMRSARVAQLLATEGVTATNAGGIGDLASAGWPIVPPRR
ncbi:rhodanese-like domain-containing protein [Opitutus sp. ER46]|uniref:rhodanese-like domain-containing protein n=1 Tax=Opitutus sp. ER46 TaxID=2161864 RepID=UPI000D30A843|nr:rhodanese-like domain-containing protein [Opitutus sp. ER46]PTY00657.1 sulfurtransferase [Opitutus sp. ER46]